MAAMRHTSSRARSVDERGPPEDGHEDRRPGDVIAAKHDEIGTVFYPHVQITKSSHIWNKPLVQWCNQNAKCKKGGV